MVNTLWRLWAMPVMFCFIVCSKDLQCIPLICSKRCNWAVFPGAALCPHTLPRHVLHWRSPLTLDLQYSPSNKNTTWIKGLSKYTCVILGCDPVTHLHMFKLSLQWIIHLLPDCLDRKPPHAVSSLTFVCIIYVLALLTFTFFSNGICKWENPSETHEDAAGRRS